MIGLLRLSFHPAGDFRSLRGALSLTVFPKCARVKELKAGRKQGEAVTEHAQTEAIPCYLAILSLSLIMQNDHFHD